jgi:hypothetical protein
MAKTIFKTMEQMTHIFNFIKEAWSFKQKVYVLYKTSWGYNQKILISKENNMPIMIASKKKPCDNWVMQYYGHYLNDDTRYNELMIVELSNYSLNNVLQAILDIKPNTNLNPSNYQNTMNKFYIITNGAGGYLHTNNVFYTAVVNVGTIRLVSYKTLKLAQKRALKVGAYVLEVNEGEPISNGKMVGVKPKC